MTFVCITTFNVQAGDYLRFFKRRMQDLFLHALVYRLGYKAMKTQTLFLSAGRVDSDRQRPHPPRKPAPTPPAAATHQWVAIIYNYSPKKARLKRRYNFSFDVFFSLLCLVGRREICARHLETY